MKTAIYKFITSYRTTLILLILYAFILAIATWMEKIFGTMPVKVFIYYSPLFFALQFTMVLNFLATFFKNNSFKNKQWGFILVHFSLIIILTGAFISHLFGVEGTIHLREGESTNRMLIQTSRGEYHHVLPFSVELEKFTLVRYPGSSSPSSYESDIVIKTDGENYRDKVFMNHTIDFKGYRFFQASYDKDEKGTLLSVNKDVAGRNVTYFGYLFLTIGFVWCIAGKNSQFRRLNRQLKELRTANRTVILLLLIFSAFPLHAASGTVPASGMTDKLKINPEHAARFGSLPMQSYTGRIIPVNTFSSEVLRKIHKSEKVNNLNADEFLLSLFAVPEMWMRIPLIAIPSEKLSYHYDLSDDYCTYTEVFDSNGNYKLQADLDDVYSKKPGERNSFDKDLIKLDERVNILHQLLNHQMLNIFPLKDRPDSRWYAPGEEIPHLSVQDSLIIPGMFDFYMRQVSTAIKTGDWSDADDALSTIATYQAENTSINIDTKKIEAEIKYNKMEVFRKCKIYYLSLGGILLILSFVALYKRYKWLNGLMWVLGACVLVVFHFQMIGMTMRWYIAGYAPWSNSYETMIYVAWATMCGGLMFFRRNKITFSLATLFAGVILFVSGLNWMDPQINLLVPVLKSPWLMFHVAVIVAAYGFFGISFLLGITNMIMMSVRSMRATVKELSIVNEMSLIIGLALMTIGTFLGAVWANESWGRYWGWDPKETWALITVVVYAIVIHLRLVRKWNDTWLFNFSSVVAFSSVLMTYFGVNYFLSGMHSYGQNENIGGIFIYILFALVLIVGLGIVSYKRK